MKKIKFDRIRHQLGGINGPICLLDDDMTTISRGDTILSEGSKGIIFDIHPEDNPSIREGIYTIIIYWFLGPLSEDRTKRRHAYRFDKFLKFLDMEIE